MRSDIVPGAVFPDYELSDRPRRVACVALGVAGSRFRSGARALPAAGFCPKDRRQHEGLLQRHREMLVGYCRLVTLSTDNLLETKEFRTGVGAQWPFLAFRGAQLQKALDIAGIHRTRITTR